ncbi:VWA domain-containing protein [Devosia sp. FKR38]|uniref:VWA domain-containing protein n=1 Tax=Devosia sp. FKR38 TaxID=2562312 RepID=UPI0010BF7621|nr:VWA domain-containing protein [Devosia sp. FKR38]
MGALRALTAALVALMWVLLLQPAIAAPRPLALIIDSSGSMAAEMDGETRLDIARRVIVEQAATWAAGGDLGLVAYGHRRVGDCNDIETLETPAPVDLDRLRQDLGSLRARGKTPLSDSLIAASQLLPEGGAIILVSDGLETCAADPCAVAESLRDANAALSIFVVGFGVTAPELAALQCIAEQGGGSLFSAQDAAGLKTALSTAGQMAQAAPAELPPPAPEVVTPAEPVVAPAPTPEPEPAPTPPPPPTPLPVSLMAMTSAGEVTAPLGWTITADGADAPLYEGAGRGVALELLPGQYTADVAGDNLRVQVPFVVAADQGDKPITIAVEAGQAVLHLVAGEGLSLADAELGSDIAWSVTPLDGQSAVTTPTGLDPSLMLVPGRYGIEAVVQGHVAKADIEVTAGAVGETELSLALGRLALELVLDSAEGPVTKGTGLNWTITPAAGGEAITVTAAAQPRLVLPAGDYTVAATLDGTTVTGAAQVVDGAEAKVSLSNAAAEVMLEASFGDGPPIEDWHYASWTVTPVAVADGSAAALVDNSEPRPVLKLAPGQWDVTLQSGVASTTQRITVAPGLPQTIRIKQAAGLLRLTGSLSGVAFTDWRDTVWTLRSADGSQTLLNNQPELEPVLVVPAGDWVVTLVSGAVRAEQAITMPPGDDQAIAMALSGGRLLVDLPAGMAAMVKVSALDATGNPLTPPTIEGPAAPQWGTVLPPGQYLVEAPTYDNRYASAPLEIVDGQSQSIALQFD